MRTILLSALLLASCDFGDWWLKPSVYVERGEQEGLGVTDWGYRHDVLGGVDYDTWNVGVMMTLERKTELVSDQYSGILAALGESDIQPPPNLTYSPPRQDPEPPVPPHDHEEEGVLQWVGHVLIDIGMPAALLLSVIAVCLLILALRGVIAFRWGIPPIVKGPGRQKDDG